jgi:YHS domain-containing protein
VDLGFSPRHGQEHFLGYCRDFAWSLPTFHKGGFVMPGKTFVNKLLFVCALLSLNGAFAAQTYAQQQPPFDALEGLDPVLLSQGKEAQGETNITVTRGQFRYMFANAANKAAFEQDPTRYEIQLNGACARMGAPVQGNPDLYAVHKGHIYIFGSDNCKTLFVAAPEKYLGPGEGASATAATPEALKQAQALIDKAVAAMGGAVKIDGLTSFREKSVAPQTRGPMGEIEVKVNLDLLIVFPDRFRFALSMPDYNDPSVTIQPVIVILPGEAFAITRSGVRPAPDAARADQERQIQRKPLSILRARNGAGFKAVAVGPGKTGEIAVEKVTVELQGARYTLGVDPATGRILSVSYNRRGPQGTFGEFTQTYSDFRAVDGLTLPFKVDATFDGQPWKNQSSTIETIVINGAIDPALFEKPKQGQ